MLTVIGGTGEHPAATFKEDAANPVLVSVSDWKDKFAVDFRELWQPDKAKDEFARTKKGVRIPIEELGNLIDFLQGVWGLCHPEEVGTLERLTEQWVENQELEPLGYPERWVENQEAEQ